MRRPNPEETRIETLTAALIYMAPVLRDVCPALHGSWAQVATLYPSQRDSLH